MLEIEISEYKIHKYEKAEPILLKLGFVKKGSWGFSLYMPYKGTIDYYPTTCTVKSGLRSNCLSMKNLTGIVKLMQDKDLNYSKAYAKWFGPYKKPVTPTELSRANWFSKGDYKPPKNAVIEF